jgi:hypothetical protein
MNLIQIPKNAFYIQKISQIKEKKIKQLKNHDFGRCKFLSLA